MLGTLVGGRPAAVCCPAECVTGTPHCTARVNTCCVENIHTNYTVEEEKIRTWDEVEKQEKR